MKIEYSLAPTCDICQADTAECYPPENEKGYSGLCKQCFHIFYNQNQDLFDRQQSEELKAIE